MFKKIIIYLLSGVLILSLTACGEKSKYEKAERLKDEQKYDEAIALFTELGDYQDAEGLKYSCYDSYLSLLCFNGEYSKALEIGEEYKKNCDVDILDVEDYVRIYEGVNKILNSDEDSGWALLKKQAPTNGKSTSDVWRDVLEPAIGGDDKDKQLKAYRIVKYISGVTNDDYNLRICDDRDSTLKYRALDIGETFTFGKYYQDYDKSKAVEEYGKTFYITSSFSTNCLKQPVEWVVLDRDGSKILAITKDCIDCANCGGAYVYDRSKNKIPISEYLPTTVFNAVCSDKAVLWEDSAVRAYLNSLVRSSLFMEHEWKYIAETTIDSCKTKDSIFLLSYAEVEKYKNVPNFYASKTEYATLLNKEHLKYAMTDSDVDKVKNEKTWWALRKTANDPSGRWRAVGCSEDEVYWVTDGYKFLEEQYKGYPDTHSRQYIRPAVWFDFSVE